MHRKKPCVGGALPFKTYFIGRASSGRDRILRSKTDSQLLSLSLCSAWNSRFFENLELLQKKLAALTSGRVWTLNQHLVTSRKKALKAWNYAKRTSSIKQHRATSQATTEGHPQSDVTQRHDTRGFQPGNETADQRSFQLKSKYQTKPLFCWIVGYLSRK